MTYLNVFEATTTEKILDRLASLEASTSPQWGKMDAPKMLAHLCVSYDMAYGAIKVNNSAFKKLLFKLFVKKAVVGEKPYPKNSRTAPEFIIKSDKDFEQEKARFIAYVKRVEKDGVAVFEGKESPSFGPLSAGEWSILFYKHLDHHFRQFGI
ncbi:MAG: DUF1569 domain-containing protein [Bacteroidota bacterium]